MTRTELPTDAAPLADGPAQSILRRPWDERLAFVVDTMRDLSRQTDPQELVRTYSTRIQAVRPTDAFLSLSRRGLSEPHYRVTRSSSWPEPVNPWKQPHLLPVLEGGLLGRLIYGDEPVVIDDLSAELRPDDPAAPYLAGYGSMVAVPLYDAGTAMNMAILLKRERAAFDREELPERVWMSNLFGRATQNLVLSAQVKEAYDVVDRELKVVGDIQRSLLPRELPAIPTLELAAAYQTSQRAGGDYYDFFPLPGGQWGILIADVSGHGTPAAVLMAVTHSIAHTCADPKTPPSRLLSFVNARLAEIYTSDNGNFVTAFYGIYDPAKRELAFCNAGHPPPRLRRPGGAVVPLHGDPNLPLGIEAGERYDDHAAVLSPGDTLVFYTDGITEARDPSGELLGTARLDDALAGLEGGAAEMVEAALAAVERFTGSAAANDDRTLLVAKVS